MNGYEWYMIIWGAAVLALAGGALASYRLSWKRNVTYMLIWACIFTAVALLFNAVGA